MLPEKRKHLRSRVANVRDKTVEIDLFREVLLQPGHDVRERNGGAFVDRFRRTGHPIEGILAENACEAKLLRGKGARRPSRERVELPANIEQFLAAFRRDKRALQERRVERSAGRLREGRMAERARRIGREQDFKAVANRIDGLDVPMFALRWNDEELPREQRDRWDAVEFVGVFAVQTADDRRLLVAVPERTLGRA